MVGESYLSLWQVKRQHTGSMVRRLSGTFQLSPTPIKITLRPPFQIWIRLLPESAFGKLPVTSLMGPAFPDTILSNKGKGKWQVVGMGMSKQQNFSDLIIWQKHIVSLPLGQDLSWNKIQNIRKLKADLENELPFTPPLSSSSSKMVRSSSFVPSSLSQKKQKQSSPSLKALSSSENKTPNHDKTPGSSQAKKDYVFSEESQRKKKGEAWIKYGKEHLPC